jgi:hypothetical protein
MLHFVTQLLQDLTVKCRTVVLIFEEKEVLENVQELSHVEEVQHHLSASDSI